MRRMLPIAIALTVAWALPARAADHPKPGLAKAQNLSDLQNKAAARVNLSVAGIHLDGRFPTYTDDVNSALVPGSDWRFGSIVAEMQIGPSGNAIWQPLALFPYPRDAVAWSVASVAVSGGTGYVTGDTITLKGGVKGTITATGGVPSAVTLTQPLTYGCPPSGAIGQSATSGLGTGASFVLSMSPDVIYATRRATICYTGAVFQMTRADTGATQDIGFLPDGRLDTGAAMAFAATASNPEQFALYNSDVQVGITKWYDEGPVGQGGSQANAATATTAYMPVLDLLRTLGDDPSILFPAQMASTAAAYPAQSYFVIPSSYTINGQAATLVAFGSMLAVHSTYGYLNQVSGSGTLGIGAGVGSGDQGVCTNVTAGNGADTVFMPKNIPETPDLAICNWGPTVSAQNGNVPQGAIIHPGPTVNAGSIYKLTPSGASVYNSTAAAVTYTAVSGDTSTRVAAALAAAVDSSAAIGLAGGSALWGPVQGAFLDLYSAPSAPITWTPSCTGTGCSLAVYTFPAPGNYNFSGGAIGQVAGGNSGDVALGYLEFAQFSWPAAAQRQFTASLYGATRATPQSGLAFNVVSTSISNGFDTPRIQDWLRLAGKGLQRTDLTVVNESGTGGLLSTWASTLFASEMAPQMAWNHVMPLANNVTVIHGGYNDAAAGQTAAQIEASYQSLAGQAHAALPGSTVWCITEMLRNKSATPMATMQAVAASLMASPGGCDHVTDLMTAAPWMANPSIWPLPGFEQQDTGGHPSAAGTWAMMRILADSAAPWLQ